MSSKYRRHQQQCHKLSKKSKVEEDNLGSNSIILTLDPGKRYSHTATCTYQLLMASLQPDERKLPNCACNIISKEGRKYRGNQKPVISEDQVVVVVEHDLKEHILCILDMKKSQNYKLNLVIQPGEQIAYRTVGRIPVQLSGVSSEAH